jgi:2-polyprenyl-3-methyl-5-hydroxy-6-metoxy-1,4-benzoquinol methylase
MPRLTKRDSLVYGNLWADPPNFRPSDTSVAMINELTADANDSRPHLADIACGGGRHAIYAAENGCDVTAIDHNEVAVTGLRERAASLPVEVLRADLVDWVAGQHAKSFDAVICFDAIHHISSEIDDVDRSIRRMAGLLRPRGFLLITFLADVVFGNGERPPGRLELTAEKAAALLDAGTGSLETVKRAQRDIERDVQSVTPKTGELAATTYRATRLLRLCRAAS